MLSSLAIAAGLLGTLSLLVFCLAGSGNSSPQQAQRIKWFMIASGAGGLLCLGGGVALLVLGKPSAAALVGALPMIVVIAGMFWLVVSSGS